MLSSAVHSRCAPSRPKSVLLKAPPPGVGLLHPAAMAAVALALLLSPPSRSLGKPQRAPQVYSACSLTTLSTASPRPLLNTPALHTSSAPRPPHRNPLQGAPPPHSPFRSVSNSRSGSNIISCSISSKISSTNTSTSTNTNTNTSSSRTSSSSKGSPARKELSLPLSTPIAQREEPRRLPPAPAMAPGAGDGADKKLGVLFVCLGNICRSPTAEAVFRDAVRKQGLEDRFRIDSAGTIDYHEGDPADARMRRAAAQRGIDITSISRPLRASDFSEFDVIMAMDAKNLSDIRSAYKTWSRNMDLPANGLDKVGLICDYCKTFDTKEVPDPYYGGPQGFELVLDLLDDACSQLLESLKAKAEV